MPRFFVNSSAISDNNISIVGEDAHHIARSLRMAVGDDISICDMQSLEYQCVLKSITDTLVCADIVSTNKSQTEPPYIIKLFQGVPKGDKFDMIIQKAVECGASSITPFTSEHSIVKIKKEDEYRKNERRNRIAYEAAKQCGRGIIPKVMPSVDFEQMLKLAVESELCVFCYEGENTVPLGKIVREYKNTPLGISVIVGSEGGFSEKEVEKAQNMGILPVGLGKRILRTETASTFVLSAFCYEFELQK